MNNINLTNIGPGGNGPNYIKFSGLTGDANNHTVISERQHDAINEATELFIGKAKENRT